MQRLREKDPQQIGPYTLVARLGAGGMGTVFLGADGIKQAAIKVAREGFLDDPSLRTRFEREIATLARMDSPYIARFLGSAIEEDLAWHAVEFVNGPTLADRVEQDGPLNQKEWSVLAEEIRLALDAVHKVGIVHRDLKPSNIILSELGMKLIDFGIAWDSDQTSVTTTGMVAGSPAWLAPEQLDGLPVTQETDLFSAGSVLTFAATGRSPWGRTTTTSVSAVVARIASHKPDLSGLTSEQCEVVEGLLAADPRARAWHFPAGTQVVNRGPARPLKPRVNASPLATTKIAGAPGTALSPASELFKKLRLPAIPWALGMVFFAFSTSALLNLLTVALLLGSVSWAVVRTVRFFRRFSVRRAWLSAIIAVPGSIVLTFAGLLLMSVLFWR